MDDVEYKTFKTIICVQHNDMKRKKIHEHFIDTDGYNQFNDIMKNVGGSTRTVKVGYNHPILTNPSNRSEHQLVTYVVCVYIIATRGSKTESRNAMELAQQQYVVLNYSLHSYHPWY